MTSPTTSSSTSSVGQTTSLNINALLGGDKWGGATGTGVTVSYSFPWTSSSSATFSGHNGIGEYSSLNEPDATYHYGLSTTQQAAARSALQSWANVANITFSEVAETSSNVGDIRLAWTSATDLTSTGARAWGWAGYPDSYWPSGGDVWISTLSSGATNSDWSVGSYNFEALIHELGHALGLKHPFESNPVLSGSQDSRQYTVMSYTPAAHSLYVSVTHSGNTWSWSSYNIEPSTPMLYDIQAMQYLYGANTGYNTGDNTYTFDPTVPFIKTIWDAGGKDTLSVSNFSLACTIDLRPGSYSKISYLDDITAPVTWTTAPPTPTFDGTDDLAIAYGCIIENAIGGSGNDTLIGNDANNSLDGGAGNDTLYGGAGNDTFDWDSTARGGNDVFYGGTGNDTFVLNSVLDTVIEYSGEGTDTVWVSFSYSIANLPNIENLSAFGLTGVTLTGNAANNNFSGTSGNDTIDGGAGNDTVSYSGVSTNYTIASTSSGFTITSTTDGTDTMKNVEFVAFSNQTITLTAPDITAPTVSSFSPADEATSVAIGSNFVVTFSEAIAKGTGNIVLKTAAGATVATYDAATSANLSISGSTLTINPTVDLGYSTGYKVEFSAGTIKDLAGNSYAGTTSYNFTTVAYVNSAPTGAVTISGTATQGQTLTAANTLADVDGLGTISYQWKADGSNIVGATSSTFVLAEAQVGRAITVTASYTDGHGTAESKTSSVTALVANVNDVPTGSVTINGVATQGQTLTLTNTLDDLDGLGTFSYQWKSDGVAIPGATLNSLTLSQAQVGKTVTVAASYTDGHGTAESVASAVSSVVANTNDAPTGSVTISGSATQGQTLTAANTLADADGLGAISYQWQSAGVNIAGATVSTFTLTQAQVGKAVSVLASYTDGFGTAESQSSNPTTTIASSDTTPPTLTITDNLPGTANRTTGSVAYSLAFSEAVTGLDASDFTLTNGTVSSVSGSGTAWTVNVTPALDVASGTIGLTLKAGAVSDAAGNLNAIATNASQAIDTLAPTASFSPGDEAASVAIASNIVLTFNEAIAVGTGNIVLKTAAGTTVATFDAASSANLSITGSTLTINPSADLAYSTGYKVEFAADTIKDLAGNCYVGTTSYNFTTIAPANQTFTGTSANESFTSGPGNDSIDGGAGLDTVIYSGNRANFALTKTSTGFTLIDNTGAQGTDTLQNVERLKFTDGGIALDVGADQPGGGTQLLLGAVLGKDLLASKQPIIGAVIDLFDQGYTLQQLSGAVMRLPIWVDLTGQSKPTNTDIANYLLWRVNGGTLDATTLASAVASLDAQPDIDHNQGNFLWHLAESSANQTQVGLVGLATTGLAYM